MDAETTDDLGNYYETIAASTASLDLKDFNLVRDFSEDMAGGLWGSELRAFIDNTTLKLLFFTEDWVYILIDRIASKISSQRLRVMKEVIVNGTPVAKPEENHPFQKILDRPNEFQDYHGWMYSTVVDLACLGNSIIYYAPNLKQLLTIPAELIRLDFDGRGFLRSYQVQSFSRDDQPFLQRNNGMIFDPKSIAHARRSNPSSLMWGLSPLIPGRKSILFNRYSSEYLNNYYIKGAQPGMAFELQEGANEKSALRLLRSFELAYTGRRNQRRSMVVPKGVKLTPVSHTLADQQLRDYILTNRETLINIFQVPKHELSIAETGSLGSEEYKTALKNFWDGPLKSYMRLIAGEMTATFQAYLGTGRYLEFDLSDVEILQENEDQKAALAEKLLKTHTLNEVRAKVYTLPPVANGDVVLGYQPQQTLFPSFGGQPQTSPPLPEGVKPPAVVAETTEAKAIDTKEVLSRNLDSFSKAIKDGGSWWDEREKRSERGASEHTSKINRLVLNLFSDQAEAIIRSVRKNTVEKAADIPSKARLRRRLLDALNKFEDKWVTDYLKTLEAQVELGYETSLILPFNVPSKSEIEALRARNGNKRLQILEERGLETFENISRTTTEKVMNLVAQGVAQSKTVQDIAKDIEDYFTDAEVVGSRAMTIARTETLTASSLGQAAAMKDAATVIPNLKKMWINAGDLRVRGNPGGLYPDAKADHWVLGGEVRPHDAKFSNGLLYPRDPNGPPGETIQCRCTFIMVPEEDAGRLGLEELTTEFGG